MFSDLISTLPSPASSNRPTQLETGSRNTQAQLNLSEKFLYLFTFSVEAINVYKKSAKILLETLKPVVMRVNIKFDLNPLVFVNLSYSGSTQMLLPVQSLSPQCKQRPQYPPFPLWSEMQCIDLSFCLLPHISFTRCPFALFIRSIAALRQSCSCPAYGPF